MVMVIFFRSTDWAGQLAYDTDNDRRRAEGGGPGAETVIRSNREIGSQKVRSSASDLLLHPGPATARYP